MTKYGPGDEITWPACTGHPLDPRTPEPEDEDNPDEDAETEDCDEN